MGNRKQNPVSQPATRAVRQAEYARYRGVRRKTVTAWKQKGVLVLDENGLVLVEESDRELARHGLGGSSAPAGTPKVTDGGNDPSDDPDGSEDEGNDGEGNAEDRELTDEELALRMALGGFVDIAEAKRIKEVYRGLLNKLEYERKAGSLVPKSQVISLFQKRWGTERKAWEDWPSKAAPGLAGRFKIDAVEFRVALEEEVHKFLRKRTANPDIGGLTGTEAGDA